MIISIELGPQVAISMELSASEASQIRIEIRTEVRCCCDCISRVHSLDFVRIQSLNMSYMYVCLSVRLAWWSSCCGHVSHTSRANLSMSTAGCRSTYIFYLHFPQMLQLLASQPRLITHHQRVPNSMGTRAALYDM